MKSGSMTGATESSQNQKSVDLRVLVGGFWLMISGLYVMYSSLYGPANMFATGGLVGALGIGMVYHGLRLGGW